MIENRYYYPKELFKLTNQELNKYQPDVLFNSSHQGITKLTESWCASMFGLGYSEYIRSCKIKIIEDQFNSADFTLKIKDNVFDFQITEVLKKARKRGKEYKDNKDKDYSFKEYHPEEGRKFGPDWIYESIQKKVLKFYSNSSNLNLLVYVNFSAHQMVCNKLRNKLDEFKNTFRSIWLMTDMQLLSIFSEEDLGFIEDWLNINKCG